MNRKGKDEAVMKKSGSGVMFLVVLACMLLVSALFLAAMSMFMLGGHMTAGFISGAVIAAYVFSCLTGGFCVGRYMGKYKFMWGSATGCCYFCILFVTGRLLYHSALAVDLQVISSFLICIVSGMLGGMLAPAAHSK